MRRINIDSDFVFYFWRDSTHSLAAPLDEFDCAHWLTNIPLLLLLFKSSFFPAFSRKVPVTSLQPCPFSLSAGKNILIFALRNTRQIALFLFTLCLSKCPSRLEIESLYFRFKPLFYASRKPLTGPPRPSTYTQNKVVRNEAPFASSGLRLRFRAF